MVRLLIFETVLFQDLFRIHIESLYFLVDNGRIITVLQPKNPVHLGSDKLSKLAQRDLNMSVYVLLKHTRLYVLY